MKVNGIGQFHSINAFVEAKINAFAAAGKDFYSLFTLMFSEGENIMYEKSVGYKIVRTTYGESRAAVKRRAATLQTLTDGFSKDDVIGIHMDNGIEWIENFWAVLLCGYRPLLMNLRLSRPVLEDALATCGAKLVISQTDGFTVRTVGPLAAGDLAFEPARKNVGTEVLLTSSGTTEHLKICAYSANEFYEQICCSLQMIRTCPQLKAHVNGDLKLLTLLPFYHIFGLVAVYIWFAFFSRTFVHLADLQPDTVVNTVRRHKVTHIFAVPLFWEKVYDSAQKAIAERGEATAKKFEKALAIAKKTGDLPVIGDLFSGFAFGEVRENLFGESVRFLITGGSAIRPEVLAFFNAIGYRLANGYGMSEIGITSVELSNKKKILNSGSVGKPLGSVSYSLSADGELLVCGRTLAKYIIEDGKKQSTDGLFHTRDLAACENGRYKILGRKDDVVITADGENLNPNLIEPQLVCPGVNGVCLIGGEDGGRKTAVLIVSLRKFMPQAQFERTAETLKARIKEQNLTGRIAKIVYTTDPLVSPDEFKVNRLRIAKAYRAGSISVFTPGRSEMRREDRDALMQRIRAFFALALDKNEEEIPQDADFFSDGGGTSLDYFALISKLQEEFSVTFPTAVADCPSTIRGLYDYIKAAIGE